MNTILFQETQKFRQPWILLILAGICAVILWGFVQQIIIGRPWGNNPSSDPVLILLSLLPFALTLLILYLRLETKITKENISYKFSLFHRKEKSIAWKDVKQAYVRQYKPISEYGGWGLRYSSKNGKAFNVSGNMGLQLVLKGGKKVLIGTQKPEELKGVINKVGKFKN